MLNIENANTKNYEDAIEKASRWWGDENNTSMSFNEFVDKVNALIYNLNKAGINYSPSEEQIRILYTRANRLCADSSAGTGKTTTILFRQLIELTILGYSPNDILTITYTESSAKDLYSKFYKLVERYHTGELLNYTTIHSKCLSILKVFMPERVENIITEDNKVLVTKYEVTEDMDYEEVEVMVSIKDLFLEACEVLGFEELMKDTKALTDIYKHYSIISERLINTREEYEEYCIITGLDYLDYDIYTQLIEKYSLIKQNYGIIDYNDMLLLTKHILENIEDYYAEPNTISRELQDLAILYKIIYVDEVQDISPLQSKILDLLLKINGEDTKLVVIGDCDQSIYYFRGADVKYILNFDNRYENTEHIFLTRNRRSTSEIINLGNEIIKNNINRPPKVARGVNGVTHSNPSGMRLVEIPEGTSDNIVNNYIFNYVKNASSPSDIAVIYREHKQLSSLLTDLLINRIPFNTKLGFNSNILVYNNYILKRFCNLVQLMKYPKEPNLIKDFLKFLNYSSSSIENIINEIKFKNTKLLKILSSKLKKESITLLTQIYTLIQENTLTFNVFDIFTLFLVSIDKFKPNSNVVNYILNRNVPISEFDRVVSEDKTWVSTFSNSGILLTSSHSSKGLEFKNVIVLPISDNTTPKKSIIEDLSEEYSKEYIEEERRLLYVTVTRAINSLTILIVKNCYFYNEIKTVFEDNNWEVI